MEQTNWYVIQVMTGNEQIICRDLTEILDKSLYEHCFVPMSERQHRKDGKFISLREPLFPGYLFIISDFIDDISIALWKISKFKRILRTGSSFVPMEPEEVNAFSALVDEAFNITMSKGFIIGDAITVTEGPLKGYEGSIKKIDRHKRMAFVELPFLGKEIRVRIPLEIVDKL
jgi:transcriptional antiterminator NusG